MSVPKEHGSPPGRRGVLPGTHAESHKAGQADWFEESVFGVLDGVITALALVVTVAVVLAEPSHTVFLTVLAAAVAGTLSMFVGALLSSQSRAALIASERKREEWEVDHVPDIERREVEDIYRAQGYGDEEVAILVRHVTSDKQRWVDMMMRDELGLDPDAPPEPLRHAGVIALSYIIGGGIPALPFLLNNGPTTQLLGHALAWTVVASLGLGGLILAVVGVLESRFSGRSVWRGVAQIVSIGFATAILVFLVTVLLAPT